MHPLMKHRKNWGPHSLKWPQPISLSFSNMFSNSVFYMQSKTAWWFRSFWHNVFYSSVSEETESCLPASQWQENGCWDFQLGGKNEKLQSVEARSRESWRRDKNVSIHANWCPDPPPGCHCLLSGEGIKGPFTRHKDFHFFSTRPHPIPLTLLLLLQLPYLIGAERGTFPLRFIQERKSRFCLFKVNMEMPECTQPTSLPEQRGRSYRVQSESDDWWL